MRKSCTKIGLADELNQIASELFFDGIFGDIKIRRHKEFLAFPSASIAAVQGWMLVDAPEAPDAPGPHRVSPKEAVGSRVDVQVAPPHRERQMVEREAVGGVWLQLVQ